MDYRRFFTKNPIINGVVTLDGEEFIHCVKVTRHKVNFKIIVNNNSNFDYLCQITEIQKDTLFAKVLEITKNDSELVTPITLYQAVCKEFDFIVQKAVELGITKIIPFYSEFSQQYILNEDRLDKIVFESAKQCGRAVLPTISPAITFDEMLLNAKKNNNTVLFYEKCNSNQNVSSLNFVSGDIAVIIGSEGGFSENEIASAQNIKVCSLGKRILRAETAAIVAIALIENRINEL